MERWEEVRQARKGVEGVMQQALAARKARLEAGEDLESYGPSEPNCGVCKDAKYVRRRDMMLVDSRHTANPTQYETQVIKCPSCVGVEPEVMGAPAYKTFAEWETFEDMIDAQAACFELLEGSRWCVFLRGKPGCGKTHLAIATAYRWAERNGRAVFANVPSLLDELRQCYATDTNPQPVLDRYIDAGFLVMDDFGAERETAFAVESLYKIIDRRYQRKAPTIVTTNWTRDELDSRVLSRLRPGEVQIKADDRRGVFER